MEIKGLSVEAIDGGVYILVRDSDAVNAVPVREITLSNDEWKQINDSVQYGALTAADVLGFEPPASSFTISEEQLAAAVETTGEAKEEVEEDLSRTTRKTSGKAKK